MEEGSTVQSRGRRRRVVVVLAACVLVAIGVIALWPGEGEPEYNGKKLSEWLDGYEYRNSEEQADAAKAVRAIGTNALPYLLKRFFFHTPAWKVRGFNMSKRLCPPLSPIFYEDHQKRFQDGMDGFRALGPGGGLAIPELVRMARGTNPGFASTAVVILGTIGDDAMPAVFDILTNRQAYPSVPAYLVGGTMSDSITNKGPVLEALMVLLKSDDVQVRRNATTMLGDLRANSDLTVSTMIELLKDADEKVRHNAIMALRNFHKEARPAAESLLGILSVTKPGYIRDAVIGTLKEVAPEVLTNRATEVSR